MYLQNLDEYIQIKNTFLVFRFIYVHFKIYNYYFQLSMKPNHIFCIFRGRLVNDSQELSGHSVNVKKKTQRLKKKKTYCTVITVFKAK